MTDRVALKDQLFHRGNVARIAAELAAVDPGFDAERFTERVVERFGELELKQRIAWIAVCLSDQLPGDYRDAVGVLLASLPAPCDPTLGDGDFGDFIYAPYSRFVADHGCTPTDLEFSLNALCEITTRVSAEDAIRRFINTFPDQTLAVIIGWCEHPHYHVRRLCSEGTRPRLPWSTRLTTPTSAAVPILDTLYADRSRFVTRSVANHVNDIAKHDPGLAIDLLERWRAEERQQPRELDYVIRHATRSLVKDGNSRAFAMLGVASDAPVTVTTSRAHQRSSSAANSRSRLPSPPQTRLS
jgi:3-methyladenine DNA glycosylase AlkC